jgi:hypothetical protein
MKESDFQKKLIDKIKMMFPDCEVMKQDPKYCTGIPDLVIFYQNKYAMLECKNSLKAYEKSLQNQSIQTYYIEKFSKWSYASYVYPENMDKVLYELQEVFSK